MSRSIWHHTIRVCYLISSVDTFFESLAEAKKIDAIGIVLSGTGSDGAKGIAVIRKHNGITIAQDEMTAKYSSMPAAAMDTGLIDLIMSPEEIGAQFEKIISEPRNLDALKASPINYDEMSELLNLLQNQTNVNFKYYKTPTFQRRVERRMAAVKKKFLMIMSLWHVKTLMKCRPFSKTCL